MEKLKKQVRCKTSKDRKRLFKMYIKTKRHTHKIFDNNLEAIRKSKRALNLANQHTLECAYQN